MSNKMERLRYAFDNLMSKGTVALVASLGLLCLLLIVLISILATLIGATPEKGVLEVIWLGLMRTIDSGAIAGDEGSWIYLLFMGFFTLCGIFVMSSFIGLLTTGFEEKIESLRRGRSKVIEHGHTVVLGWADEVFALLSELVEANKSKPGKHCIVILGDREKVEMEDEIRFKVPPSPNTRLVCRTGDPIDMDDLDIVSLETSKSIIVLAPPGDGHDITVIKTLLAVSKKAGGLGKVVAALADNRNLEAARLVGDGRAELVSVGDSISRIVAQTSRQSGLSSVYLELLDFQGNEIYPSVEAPALKGKYFKEALLSFKQSTLIGITPMGSSPKLNPPMETLISEGDRLILIAEDAASILPGQTVLREHRAPVHPSSSAHAIKAERTLIVGYNSKLPIIVEELDKYVPKGSLITVLAEPFGMDEDEVAALRAKCKKAEINIDRRETTDREVLESVKPGSYDHLILLSYSDHMELQQADARTLITLLQLRAMAKRDGSKVSIVSEILDMKNRDLAEGSAADDFIISNKIVSLLLAQISEQPALNAVFTDLFDEGGSEVYLKPADRYAAYGVETDFYAIAASAASAKEVAIGYRKISEAIDKGKAYGVVINPDKGKGIRFEPGDSIIVISEG